MNTIITGRTGFIAKHLIKKLQDDGHVVMGAYSLVESYSAGAIDAVIHLAAQAGIRPEQQKAVTQYEANVMQTVDLLDLCVKYKVKKFIFISSSSVYGTPLNTPVLETSITDKPLCHYAATKRAGELACYTYHYLHGIDVAILRPFTVYGPGQISNMAIPVFTRSIYKGEPITVFGNGYIQRDYVYVQDVVDGIAGALSMQHGYEVYNIGTGYSVSIIYLIRAIEQKLGKTAEIYYQPLPNGEAQNNYANIKKARDKFGYSPKVSIDEGLEKYIDWFLKEGNHAI